MSPAPQRGGWRPWLLRLAQLAASLAVLWVLWRDADLERLPGLLRSASLPWLAAALAIKTLSLVVHELRLWLALRPPRPPVRTVIAIGFVAGILNLILPARAGDFAAMALLWKECRVPSGVATAVVGLVAFLEAVVFGVIVLGILVYDAARWRQVIGEAALDQALQVMTGGTLIAIGVAVAVVITARIVAGGDAPPPGPGPLTLLRDALASAGSAFSSLGWMTVQVGSSVVQVVLLVGAFACLFPALNLPVAMPWLAAAGVLVISSLAAFVLPPSLGAGPAAASVAVLAVFSIDHSSALAYAAGYWLVGNLPAVLFGIPALWTRRGLLTRDTLRPGGSPPEGT